MTSSVDNDIEEILEDMFMVGVQHETRTIPEIEKLQVEARTKLKRLMVKERIDELQLIEKLRQAETSLGAAIKLRIAELESELSKNPYRTAMDNVAEATVEQLGKDIYGKDLPPKQPEEKI